MIYPVILVMLVPLAILGFTVVALTAIHLPSGTPQRRTFTVVKKIILVVIVVAVSYNSSGWCAGVRDWCRAVNKKRLASLSWNREHYWVALKCYRCFQPVHYLQEKGKPPAQAEAKCRNCDSVNTYLADAEAVCTHCRAVNRRSVRATDRCFVDKCRECGVAVVFHPWRMEYFRDHTRSLVPCFPPCRHQPIPGLRVPLRPERRSPRAPVASGVGQDGL